MDHEPLCECCRVLEARRARKREKDRREFERNPEAARARWQRYNRKRAATTYQPHTSGSLEDVAALGRAGSPQIDDQGSRAPKGPPEASEATEGS